MAELVAVLSISLDVLLETRSPQSLPILSRSPVTSSPASLESATDFGFYFPVRACRLT
jgi:hypothetical protein